MTINRIIYTLFLGILVALFVGLGIAAFYPSPVAPEYPRELEYPPVVSRSDQPAVPVATPETKEMAEMREAYQKQSDTYFKETMPQYNKRVSIAALVAAIIILVLSVSVIRRFDIISDGLLLGGVFTLVYSIIRGFMSDNNTVALFTVTTVGLVVAVVVGYLKFIHPEKEKSAK